MAQIGTFKSNGKTLEPIRSKSDKAPDFRVFNNLQDVGIAYRKTSEKGNEYISLLLDDPAFAKPL
jgi:uncharacterized protein (DUF736 family)